MALLRSGTESTAASDAVLHLLNGLYVKSKLADAPRIHDVAE
jgi:hypothetical protein